MNAVRVLAETEDTVTLSRADFETLVRAREDAIDNAALDAAEEREARLGKEAARADYLPAEAVARMMDGEHPLKVWREHRGWSQRGLAAAADVSPSYLAEIERGQKPGSADALRRLAAVLGVSIEDLLPPSPADGDEAPAFREGATQMHAMAGGSPISGDEASRVRHVLWRIAGIAARSPAHRRIRDLAQVVADKADLDAAGLWKELERIGVLSAAGRAPEIEAMVRDALKTRG